MSSLRDFSKQKVTDRPLKRARNCAAHAAKVSSVYLSLACFR